MKCKIILINANDFWLAKNHQECDVLLPPLGLMSLSAYLKKMLPNQLEIEILDYMADICNMNFLKEKLKKAQPNIIGIKGITTYQKKFNEISKNSRYCCPNALIIGGGPLILADTEFGLKNSECDITIMGEGEQTLYEIVVTYLENSNYFNIPNIAYKYNGDIIVNKRTCDFISVDQLPIPDYDSINLENYKKHLSYAYNKRLLGNLFTSRGCAYNCSFFHNIFGKQFRARSPESIIEEMEYLYFKGVRDFYILDDNFSYDILRATKILELIREHHEWLGSIKLYFVNGLDSRNITEEFIDQLYSAGCIYLGFAIETVSKKLQKVLNKPVNIDKIEKLIAYSNKKGMIVNYWAMIGLPGETINDAWDLIRFMQELPPTVIPMLFKLNAYPGSEIYNKASPEEQEMLNFHDFMPLIKKNPEYLKILQCWEKSILNEKRLINVTNTLLKNGYYESDISSAYQILYRSLSTSEIYNIIKKGKHKV